MGDLENKCSEIDRQHVAVKLLQEQQDKGETFEKTTFWFSKRFLIVILLFFGNVNMVMLKVNINIAVVEMTTEKEMVVGNETIYKPEFDWDSKTIGMIQSIFAYGYLFCVAGSYLVGKFGGAVVCGGSLLIMALITLLTPACIRANFYLFVAARILIGVLDGFAYTASAELLSRWAPVQERSTMMSLCFCGIYIGIAATYPICGFLAHGWGWQMIYYVTGTVCLVWSITWLILVRNQPSKDKWISERELQYVLQNTETTPRKDVVQPYKKMLLSSQVWALCVGKFTYSWGFTLLVTCFPLYVRDMTHRSTDEIGLISSIPNFVCIFMIPLAGTIMDCWQNRSNLKPTQIHKIMMCMGFITGSILFVIASYSTSFTLAMGCFIVIKLMLSFNFLILQLVCIYMSPKHASSIAGISAFWYTISTIFIPNVVGYLVQNHSLEEWSRCFFLSGGVLLCGAVFFMIYGSSELQPWATPSSSGKIKNKKLNSIENIISCEA